MDKSPKAIFLDRDGTINFDFGYVYRVQQFEFLNSSICGMKKMVELGYRLFIITNQAGVARGYYTLHDVNVLHGWLSNELARHSIPISEYLVCPHHPDFSGYCACRKPGNFLIEQAISNYKIDRASSWMIGDKNTDFLAATKSKLSFIGITKHSSSNHTEFTKGVIEATNLWDAARIIEGGGRLNESRD